MGSCRKATRPASVKPTVRSVVPTGRLMNGSLMLTARSPPADRPAARSGPAAAAAAGRAFLSAAAPEHPAAAREQLRATAADRRSGTGPDPLAGRSRPAEAAAKVAPGPAAR